MFVANIFYACAITFTKLSIIVSYLRIFPYRTVRIAMYVTAAITIGLFVASVPATIFQCSPVSAAWDLSRTAGGGDARCFTFVNFLYASTAINVTTDLVLCTAPLPYFWNLQMPRKQKAIVSALFLVGGFACVASVVRLSVLHLLTTSVDVTWHLAPSVLWTVAECTIGICCVSVPAMRPLFGRLVPAVFSTSRAASYAAAAARDSEAERRRAYAMGPWGDGSRGGETGTPTDEERGESRTYLAAASVTGEEGEEQVPREWLGGDAKGLGFTVTTTCVAVGGVEKPERVLRKG